MIRTAAGLGIGLLLACLFACAPETAPSEVAEVDLAIEPDPPVTGEALLLLRVSAADGPVEGASVKVEGNMSHPGMKPSFAELEEESPGLYRGRLDFNMAGDWLLWVRATTRDGRSLEREIEVPGVRAM